MADEISISLQFGVNNSSDSTEFPFIHSFPYGTKTFDQAAVGFDGGIESVGFAAEEDLTIAAEITTLGWFYIMNLEDAGGNYVTWGPKDTTMKAVGRLEAGEVAILRLEPGITIRWQANTAAVKVLWAVFLD